MQQDLLNRWQLRWRMFSLSRGAGVRWWMIRVVAWSGCSGAAILPPSHQRRPLTIPRPALAAYSPHPSDGLAGEGGLCGGNQGAGRKRPALGGDAAPAALVLVLVLLAMTVLYHQVCGRREVWAEGGERCGGEGVA